MEIRLEKEEQHWNKFGALKVFIQVKHQFVFLQEGIPNVKTDAIRPLVKLNPKELVSKLSGLLESLGLDIPLSIYNGKLRTCH